MKWNNLVKHYSKLDIKKWRNDGAVVIDGLFSLKEIQSVHEDIDKVFGYKKGGSPITKNDRNSVTIEEQFLNLVFSSKSSSSFNPIK